MEYTVPMYRITSAGASADVSTWITPPVYCNNVPSMISWVASQPSPSDVAIEFRSSTSKSGLLAASWSSYIRNTDNSLTSNSRPITASGNWIQVRANLSSSNPAIVSELMEIKIKHDTASAFCRWFNVMDETGSQQQYKFENGETALFMPQIVYNSVSSIASVSLSLRSPSGHNIPVVMARSSSINAFESYWTGTYTFPNNGANGEWLATLTIVDTSGLIETEVVPVILRALVDDKSIFTYGSLVNDFGFASFSGSSLTTLLGQYASASGLNVWKLSFNRATFQPYPDRYNAAMISGMNTFLQSASAAGKTVQISIQQQTWPDWANDGSDENATRFNYEPTRKLAFTWEKFITSLSSTSNINSYLIINEELYLPGTINSYLQSTAKIAGAIRKSDPDISHKIAIRPQGTSYANRAAISERGCHQIFLGVSSYPTSADYTLLSYADPTCSSSYLRMTVLRRSPILYSPYGGCGEIGFKKHGEESWGDAERLTAFERAATIAYDCGLTEFYIWDNSTFGFSDRSTYYPLLSSYIDSLILGGRPSGFDVKVIDDINYGSLFYETDPNATELDMNSQPYLDLVTYLDEGGFCWFWTNPTVETIRETDATVTISLSELSGLSAGQQATLFATRTSGVTPRGHVLMWP